MGAIGIDRADICDIRLAVRQEASRGSIPGPRPSFRRARTASNSALERAADEERSSARRSKTTGPPTFCIMASRHTRNVFVVAAAALVATTLATPATTRAATVSQGMLAFFPTTSCPAAWSASSHTGLVLMGDPTGGSNVGAARGTPLTDQQDVSTIGAHSHGFDAGALCLAEVPPFLGYLASGNIVYSVAPRPAGAICSSGSLSTESAHGNLPMAQMKLCMAGAAAAGEVPEHTVAFFATSACPAADGWEEYAPARGRTIIPASPSTAAGTPVQQSVTEALSTSGQALGVHSHEVSATVALPSNLGLYIMTSGSSYGSLNDPIALNGTSSDAETGLPYVQLLACRATSAAPGAGAYVKPPVGAHMFRAHSACDLGWQNANVNGNDLVGRLLVSLPASAAGGKAVWGGTPVVPPAVLGSHKHDINGITLELDAADIMAHSNPNLGAPGKARQVSGPTSDTIQVSSVVETDEATAGVPYLSMLLCVSEENAEAPTTSPSAPTGAAPNSPPTDPPAAAPAPSAPSSTPPAANPVGAVPAPSVSAAPTPEPTAEKGSTAGDALFAVGIALGSLAGLATVAVFAMALYNRSESRRAASKLLGEERSVRQLPRGDSHMGSFNSGSGPIAFQRGRFVPATNFMNWARRSLERFSSSGGSGAKGASNRASALGSFADETVGQVSSQHSPRLPGGSPDFSALPPPPGLGPNGV